MRHMRSEPTVFENYVHDMYVDDQQVELSLWDTAGACLVPLRAKFSLKTLLPRSGRV